MLSVAAAPVEAWVTKSAIALGESETLEGASFRVEIQSPGEAAGVMLRIGIAGGLDTERDFAFDVTPADLDRFVATLLAAFKAAKQDGVI